MPLQRLSTISSTRAPPIIYEGPIYHLSKHFFSRRWKQRFARVHDDGNFYWYRDAACTVMKGAIDLTQVASGVRFGELAVESYKIKATYVQFTLQFLLIALPDDLLENTIQWFHVNWEEELLEWHKAFARIFANQCYEAPPRDLISTRSSHDDIPRITISNGDSPSPTHARKMSDVALATGGSAKDTLTKPVRYLRQITHSPQPQSRRKMVKPAQPRIRLDLSYQQLYLEWSRFFSGNDPKYSNTQPPRQLPPKKSEITL